MWVRSLGQEDPLAQEMAAHSILATELDTTEQLNTRLHLDRSQTGGSD